VKREELLAKLDLIAPAFGNDIVPILTHIWFTGSRVVAFNDKIAISAPFQSEFKGAIPGPLTINLLKASGALDVEFATKGNSLTIKGASMDLRLAMLPAEDFSSLFTMPKPLGTSPKLSAPFLAAVEGCLRSVSADTSAPDYMGVTLIPRKDRVELFSTNDNTLSYATVKAKDLLSSRAILSTPFCEQLIKLTKDEDARLEINTSKKYALACIGDVLLFGKLIESDKPFDYDSILDKHFPEGVEKKFVPMPTKMEQVLTRAVILTDAERTPTQVTVKNGKRMDFYCRSDLHGHEMHDYIDIKHPSVDVMLDAKLLALGFGSFEEMLITDRCAIMAKGEQYYFVASRGVP
jgi:DNA polymerase III sliding clamp (beta) subunit (PCNA family)